jgi:hypothetical protein
MEEILCIDLERWRRVIVHQVQIQFGCEAGYTGDLVSSWVMDGLLLTFLSLPTF